MFDNNFGYVDRFSKFFYQVICKKILYAHVTNISTSPAKRLQYVATLPCKSRKSKNVTKFSRWTWQL